MVDALRRRNYDAAYTGKCWRIKHDPQGRREFGDEEASGGQGFVAGGNVTVVSTIGGNLIVNVKESRLAISREMASKIII